MVLEDETFSAEITERASGAPLPTKVWAEPGESASTLIKRAKDLVDRYLHEQ